MPAVVRTKRSITFDETDSTNVAAEKKAQATRLLQSARYSKACAKAARWHRKLRRAQNEVRRVERQIAYYEKTLGVVKQEEKRPRKRR